MPAPQILALNHITLTTGHARMSPRSEVDHGFLAELRPIIAEAEHHGEADLPTPSGLMLLRRLMPRSASPHVAVWAIREVNGPALATIALALETRSGAELWRELHAFTEPFNPHKTRAEDAPDAPWLGVVPHVTSLLRPDAMLWLGDAERCIAWAWIEEVYARV